MYACIDLGSNSFHLLIAHWHDGRHDIVERFSEKVQLGEGVSQTGLISPAAMARGLACLTTFRHALERYPVQHSWAVGTNALRSASNAGEFLRAARQIGFDIDVVSGHEEAALVYAGVLSALKDVDIPRLVVDIGGGSTELVVGCGERRLQTHSMAIGCISWRDQWFSTVPTDHQELEQRLDAAAYAASEVFASVAGELASTSWQEVFASSGTAKMLSSVCRQYTGSQTSSVTLDTLLALRTDIIRTALEPQFRLPGLTNSRRELVLPGWAVLVGFMRATAVQQLSFSPAALREGMLHYLVRAATKPALPLSVLRAC